MRLVFALWQLSFKGRRKATSRWFREWPSIIKTSDKCFSWKINSAKTSSKNERVFRTALPKKMNSVRSYPEKTRLSEMISRLWRVREPTKDRLIYTCNKFKSLSWGSTTYKPPCWEKTTKLMTFFSKSRPKRASIIRSFNIFDKSMNQ